MGSGRTGNVAEMAESGEAGYKAMGEDVTRGLKVARSRPRPRRLFNPRGAPRPDFALRSPPQFTPRAIGRPRLPSQSPPK